MTNRRTFLKSSITAATTAAAPAIAASSKSPNDRIRAAVVGLRGRGQTHIQEFHALASQNVELVTLCDVDERVLDQRLGDFEKLSGKKAARATDVRTVLDDREIDVVGFATPNHWHALGTIWACQAGKDVY